MTCARCSAPFPPRTHGSGGPDKRFCSERCRRYGPHRRVVGNEVVVDALRAMLGQRPLYSSEHPFDQDWLPELPHVEMLPRHIDAAPVLDCSMPPGREL